MTVWNEDMTLLATAAFGLEGLAAGELRRLGMRDVRAENGGARFRGSASDALRANLCLRCADRVLALLAEGEVRTFEALFQFTLRYPWERLLPPDARINVSGKCVRSQLMSVRDCQAIVKKAIIERLRQATGRQVFPESGAAYGVEIALHSDHARLTLDTSGTALNRRGYRTWNGDAPLRETLAAALVSLSPWRPGMPLHDPCCGTGTLLAEAGWICADRAPGLTRAFACESWPAFAQAGADALREGLRAACRPERVQGIRGSDIDSEALTLAGRHLKQAGLADRIPLERRDLRELQRPEPEGVFLCNPPYGERLSDRSSCRQLYAEMGRLQRRHPGWSLCAIVSDPGFERAFGRRADTRRRLYNGRLECEFLVFLPGGKTVKGGRSHAEGSD